MSWVQQPIAEELERFMMPESFPPLICPDHTYSKECEKQIAKMNFDETERNAQGEAKHFRKQWMAGQLRIGDLEACLTNARDKHAVYERNIVYLSGLLQVKDDRIKKDGEVIVHLRTELDRITQFKAPDV